MVDQVKDPGRWHQFRTLEQIRDVTRPLYMRLKEKFRDGVEMQLNYDELEEYVRKKRWLKRSRASKKLWRSKWQNSRQAL